jgi:hypothetical protein
VHCYPIIIRPAGSDPVRARGERGPEQLSLAMTLPRDSELVKNAGMGKVNPRRAGGGSWAAGQIEKVPNTVLVH